MDGVQDPRGTTGFENDDVQQPPVAGAVGAGPTGDGNTPEGQQPDARQEIAARLLARIPEDQRETFASEAMEAAQDALDYAGRTWQSRETRKMQEIADIRNKLQEQKVRLDERERILGQPAAGYQQPSPQQNPIAFLDAQIAQAREDGNADLLVDLKAQKQSLLTVAQIAPVFQQTQQTIQALARRLEQVTQEQDKTRLQSDPLYSTYADEVEEAYQRCNGTFTRKQLLDMVAGPELRKQAEALRSGQSAEARSYVKHQAANAVTAPSTGSGRIGVPPPPAGANIAEAIDNVIARLPGKDGKVFDLGATWGMEGSTGEE